MFALSRRSLLSVMVSAFGVMLTKAFSIADRYSPVIDKSDSNSTSRKQKITNAEVIISQ